MKIIKQNGEVVIAHSIEISGCVIKCTPNSDMRKREECGKYDNMKRATEIFSEMTHAGWNNENPEYVMPLE